MGSLYSWLLVVYFVIPYGGTRVPVQECCEKGQVLIVEDGEALCLDRAEIVHYNTTLTGKCQFIFVATQDILNFKVNDDGNLDMWRDRFTLDTVANDKFCTGSYLENATQPPVEAVGLCANTEDSSHEELLAYCMIVSVIFLVLTAVVYASLHELRDLQGKSIINLCGAFALSLALMSAMQLIPYEDMQLCAVRGFVAYFFLMATFFWMNSISIQVFRSIRKKTTQCSGWKEFSYYAAYSWGCATFLTICVVAANYIPGDHTPPGIGYDKCWFFSRNEQWTYMYSVLTVLIVVNVCIFIYTSITLWRHSFHSTSVKALRYKFCMCFRLFTVMGVAWIFEIAGSAHGENHIFWAITDVINACQGLLIFLIVVVFRRRAIKAMHKRGWLCCLGWLVDKYLSKVDDEEENVVTHTAVMSMDDKVAL